jgi:hypothetical protein
VKHLVAGGHVQGSADDGAIVGDLFLDVDSTLSLPTTEFNSALSRLVKSGLVQKLVTRPTFRATAAGVAWDDQRQQIEEDAQTWLRTKLQGGPAFADYLIGLACCTGITRDNLNIAYRVLGVTVLRGDGRGRLWVLPVPEEHFEDGGDEVRVQREIV